MAHPYSIASITSPLNSLILSDSRAFYRSYNWELCFLTLAQAAPIRRLIDVKVRALADSTTKVHKLGRLFMPLPCGLNSQRVRRCVGMGPQVHGLRLFFSDTVSPNSWHATTITPIILVSPRGDVDTTPASSAYSIPHTARRTISNVPSFLGLLFSPFGASSRYTKYKTISGSSANLCRTPMMTAAKTILNNSGDNTHPCRSPWQTLNHASPHTIVNHADDLDHPRRSSKTGKVPLNKDRER